MDWELWSDFKKLQSHLKKIFGEKAIFLCVGHSLGFAKLLRLDHLLQGIVGLNAFTDFFGLCASLAQALPM